MKKILIVDDEKAFRMSLVAIATARGFTTFEAENGQQGLEVAQKEMPDVIVCDILMPQMDGLTLLNKLKEDPMLSKIPVFVLTNIQEEIAHAAQAGAQEAIVKSSVEPEQLIDSITQFLTTLHPTS